MRRKALWIAACVPALTCGGWATEGGDLLQLARGGQSDYQVVIARDAEEPVPAAAKEFVHFFKEITGAELAIITDDQPMGEREIVIGPSKHLDNLAIYIDWEKLGKGGYVIRMVGKHLLLFGGPGRGTINAVYTFLEDHLGCRWYTPTFSVIPSNPHLSIDLIHVEKVPAFESRFFLFSNSIPATAEDIAWAARVRLNTFFHALVSYHSIQKARELLSDPRLAKSLIDATKSKERDGNWTAGRPIWWHALRSAEPTEDYGLILEREYFQEHPEYFGMDKDGKRNPHITPCLSHPDVLDIVVKNAKEWIKNTPGARFIHVSQPDATTMGWCQCPRCKKAWKKFSLKPNRNPLGHFPHGDSIPGWMDRNVVRPAWDPGDRIGATGVLLEFLNRVAEQLAKDYPDVLVATFSYYWSYYPPEGIKLHPNIVIDFAPIHACRYHPLADCIHSEPCYGLWTTMRRWRKLTPHVWVWRYDMGFVRPSIRYLDLYMRELEMAGVSGGSFHNTNDYRLDTRGYMKDLRHYLYAKLLWEPSWDMSKGIEEFIGAYYGKAAQEMLAYFLDTQESASYEWEPSKSYPFDRFHSIGSRPVNPEVVKRWERLFDAAEAKAAQEPVFLERVRVERLIVQKCAMQYLPEDDPVRVKAFRDFFPRAEKAGYSASALEEIREKFGPKN